VKLVRLLVALRMLRLMGRMINPVLSFVNLRITDSFIYNIFIDSHSYFFASSPPSWTDFSFANVTLLAS